MTPTPKTIQIYLPGGDPRGIRVAEVTTRIVQVIEVPRSLLPTFLAMPESAQVAVYFLVGESDDGAERRVYVGQSGDLHTRLKEHNKAKPFWQRALVMVSRSETYRSGCKHQTTASELGPTRQQANRGKT